MSIVILIALVLVTGLLVPFIVEIRSLGLLWYRIREFVEPSGHMKCPKCGLISPAGTIHCDCGYTFSIGQVGKLVGEANRPKWAGEPPLTGVHGWLKFLCVVLTLVAPLYVLIYYAKNRLLFAMILRLSDTVVSHPGAFLAACTLHPKLAGSVLMQLGTPVCTVYGAIAGYRLWRIRPNAVAFAKAFYLVGGGVAVIALILMGQSHRILFAAVPSVCWWLYLSLSKRVANTYGPKIVPTPLDKESQSGSPAA